MSTVRDQFYNLMNGLADSVIDAPDDEFDEPYEPPVNRCSYICGPHLEPCGLEKGHRIACACVQRDSVIQCIAAKIAEEAKWQTIS
jgi:hypothetical protein